MSDGNDLSESMINALLTGYTLGGMYSKSVNIQRFLLTTLL